MVLTWALTIAAFVLIFVELKAWSGENNPHAILGTVTTILCFLQPIGAYFRPHPGTPKRPIFNWLHWSMGNAAHIIASKFLLVNLLVYCSDSLQVHFVKKTILPYLAGF